MRLSVRVVLIATVSLFVLATVLTLVTVGELRQTSERHLEAYLALGLEYYMQEYPRRLHGLLERHGLDRIESFVQSYQAGALDSASDSGLQMGTWIEVIRSDEIRSVMLRTVLTTATIVLFASLILAAVLRLFFVAPVLRIASVARRLPTDRTLTLTESARTDELGELARNIVGAGRTIDRTQRELRESNEQLERVVEERTRELAEALAQQKTLVREVHHRVKNNMAVVQGLLDLERINGADPEIAFVMSSIQSRIASMMLIHDQLYRGDGTLSRVDSTAYLEALVRHLSRSLAATESSIVIDSQIESVPLSLEVAMPCGLITNELVSNASKYAFPGSRAESAVSLLPHSRANSMAVWRPLRTRA